MKRAVRWILSALALIALVFIGGAYVLPDSAVVQRQVSIAATPEKVFAILGDLKRFNEFSPWAEKDPAMTVRFEGPEIGPGQKMMWESTVSSVGTGAMTVADRVENRRIALDLEFGGMAASRASFELAPAGSGTSVTWGIKAPLSNPVERWVGLIMDRLIGADFEKGLAKLKAVAEKP